MVCHSTLLKVSELDEINNELADGNLGVNEIERRYHVYTFKQLFTTFLVLKDWRRRLNRLEVSPWRN